MMSFSFWLEDWNQNTVNYLVLNQIMKLHHFRCGFIALACVCPITDVRLARTIEWKKSL